ncbi:Squalene epoxidase [Mycoemilia scoparia]|uniref:squalene monooxygenase n=1 Tax=Mycoemilia scoparia TaxID=417184 RepID=A0A9W7ZUH3_9FUNG|nr:Squalene epoxidase [Mycoemilia scoparia]
MSCLTQDISAVDGHGINEGTNPWSDLLFSKSSSSPLSSSSGNNSNSNVDHNNRNIVTPYTNPDHKNLLLNTNFDIIIIGAGPVGAALAHGLACSVPNTTSLSSSTSTSGNKRRKILLIEQSWSEPDRIVGELMQPGGYQALCRLGLADVFRGIGAVPAKGYYVEYKGRGVYIPYNINKKTNKRFRGVSFHHGRFLQSLRAACREHPDITCVEAKVVDLVREQNDDCEGGERGDFNGKGRILGVKIKPTGKSPTNTTTIVANADATGMVKPSPPLSSISGPDGKNEKDDDDDEEEEEEEEEDMIDQEKADNPTTAATNSDNSDQDEMILLAPLTCVCDGIFSKFRKIHTKQSPNLRSHFIGFVMKHESTIGTQQGNPLIMPQHGHVLLSGRAPVLMYQMSDTETRVLVDVPGTQLPKGQELRSYLEKIGETIPDESQSEHGVVSLRKAYIDALNSTKRIRAIGNSFFPPTRMRIPGAVFLGDALNQRHPLTGGGMTVGLWDAVQVCELLHPSKVPDLKDSKQILKAMAKLHWKRKPLTMVINILAMALYSLFAADSPVLESLREACFEYFLKGGKCVDEPSGLLSGLLPNPLVLLYHFFVVAFVAIQSELSQTTDVIDFFKRLKVAFDTLWAAVCIFLPLLWCELQP